MNACNHGLFQRNFSRIKRRTLFSDLAAFAELFIFEIDYCSAMKKHGNLLLLILFFCGSFSFGQSTTVFEDDFESVTGLWSTADDPLPNFWHQFSCAGNGPTVSGTQSFYITPGGTGNGCTPGSKDAYDYVNSPSGTQMATLYTSVDASCAASLQVNFDFTIAGVSGEDYGQVVYSTDGGTSWNNAGSELVSTPWSNTTVALPASLDFSSFLLGFRFVYSDATVTGNPLAIDNVSVTGTDNVNPSLTCPTSILLPSDASCNALAGDYSGVLIALSDNCTDSASITITQSIAPGTNIGATPGSDVPITLTATDEAGNSSQCASTLQVRDTTGPIVICPDIDTIYLNSQCEKALPDFSVHTTASDNCTTSGSLVYAQSPPTGTTISGEGNFTVVTMTVTDAAGNSTQCNFTLDHVDTIPATITCPGNQDVYLGSSCTATVPDFGPLATVSDNCASAGSLTITQTPAPGALITDTTSITLTVSGGSPSGSNSCTFDARVIDTTGPSILCPTPTTLYADVDCRGVLPDYTASVGGSDNCGGSVTVTQNPLPTSFVFDDQTITLTATDQYGNSSSCSFQQPVLDTLDPTIICSGSFDYYADASCAYILTDIAPQVSFYDNCTLTPDLVYSQSPAVGTAVSGNGSITFTVTDEAGNTASCDFAFTVSDTTDPVIICPGTTTAYKDNNCELILADYSGNASVSDNCTTNGFFTFTQTPPAGTTITGNSQLVTLQVDDEAGNSTSCSFQVTVIDTVSPVLTSCPGDQTVVTGAQCEATLADYTSLVSAADNCSAAGDISYVQNPAAGTTISANTPISIVATDEAGNSVSCNFQVNLSDTTDPTAVCPPDTSLVLSSSCDYTIPDLTGEVTGLDNCTAAASLTISQSPAAGTTGTGTTTITMTVSDQQGNSTTCQFNAVPNDTTPPTISCPGDISENAGSACSIAVPNYIPQVIALDNCAGVNIFQSPAAGTSLPVGLHTLTMTTTDQAGNSASCAFELTIIENQDPTINCPADITTCNPQVSFSDATGSDNCLFSIIRNDGLSFQSGDFFPVGTTTLSYLAVDSSGNSAGCSFDITVLQAPSQATIVSGPISLCENGTTTIEAIAPTSGTGEWSVLSGSGQFNNQFATTTQVTGIGAGQNLYVWTVSSASCGSTYDTLEVNVYQNPSVANVPDTLFTCNDLQAFLITSAPAVGTGTWSSVEGNPISSPSSPTTTTQVLTEGWNTYVWTISNGTCLPSRDTLHIFRNIKPEITPGDTVICTGDSLWLSVSNVNVPGTSQWITASGNIELSDYTAVPTLVKSDGTGSGSVIFISHQYDCPKTSDTIQVEIEFCGAYEPDFPTVMTPNGDGKNDYFYLEDLNYGYPSCKVIIFNRWGSVIYESSGYADPWDGTYKGEALPMGTYFYRVELNDAENTVYTGSINLIR